ncbi:hypothetical protein [Nocardioides sp. W7]|uniref:hypothetical protein n=1 Tax=Nocardioides sp. W7 TaxID=2931390 RepID=UPI001FD3EBCC|nr:hypothetical protein [Nocardioides sp. W7]
MENPTTTEVTVDLELARFSDHRNEQRTRHSQALAKLMEERDDLYGVNALADLVSDSLRWTA